MWPIEVLTQINKRGSKLLRKVRRDKRGNIRSSTLGIVSDGEVDLGWCKISGHKSECLTPPKSVLWIYDLNCCTIQIIRYEEVVTWTAFSKVESDQDHRGGGMKWIADTSQLKIKRAAVETVFGTGFMAKHVLDVILQCDRVHGIHGGDMAMSLFGRFEPFKVN